MSKIGSRISAGKCAGFFAILVIGVVGRLLLLKYPNLEVVTLSALFAAIWLGGAYSIIAPAMIMMISDYFIGYDPIALFTWSGFAIMGYLFTKIRGVRSINTHSVLRVTTYSVFLVLVYDIWTAFGWWYLRYPHTTTTLALVYMLQIPFTIRHLLSALITIPMGWVLAVKFDTLCKAFCPAIVKKWSGNRKYKIHMPIISDPQG